MCMFQLLQKLFVCFCQTSHTVNATKGQRIHVIGRGHFGNAPT